jgi:glutamine amidotransferase
VIAIVDYQAGNIRSVYKAFEFLGGKASVTSDPEDIESAAAVVLPGVGHFSATASLDDMNLRIPIVKAIHAGKPFLGICVGMQWLYAGSSEARGVPGVGLIPGSCESFPSGVKSPHVGWNSIKRTSPSRLLEGIADEEFFYFTHSFCSPVGPACVSSSFHGAEFAAVLERENIFAVQFHPEKSATAGLQILRNFIGIVC